MAEIFEKKVRDNVNSEVVNPRVYNGRRKIHAECSMLMTRNSIMECIDGLKMKNTKGYDRIPKRILIDSRDVLIEPLTSLFELVYRDQVLPGQWLISKIIPVHKKVKGI